MIQNITDFIYFFYNELLFETIVLGIKMRIVTKEFEIMSGKKFVRIFSYEIEYYLKSFSLFNLQFKST